MKKLSVLVILIFLSTLAYACGGRPVSTSAPDDYENLKSMHGSDGYSYDSRGNLVDDSGNVVVDESKVNFSRALAEAIADKYAEENYGSVELRDTVIMYEHGVIVYKVNFNLEGSTKPLPINVDAFTGNIYGQGCMGGPNTKKIASTYNPDDFAWFEEKAETESIATPATYSRLTQTPPGSPGQGADSSALFLPSLLLGLTLALSSMMVYSLYSRISRIERELPGE